MRQLFSLERKKTEKNKGTDKQYAVVFVTQYNSSLSSFVANFKILSQLRQTGTSSKEYICSQRERILFSKTVLYGMVNHFCHIR